MKYDKIIEIFGEPDKDIGSGISIFVYKLNDNTEIRIGYTDRILYAKHFSENQKELDSLQGAEALVEKKLMMDPEEMLTILADEFERDDIDVASKINIIDKLVSDPRSTLHRYAVNWGDDYFKSIGKGLRKAKLKSSSSTERVYEIEIENSNSVSETKEVILFFNSNKGWVMSYERFVIAPI